MANFKPYAGAQRNLVLALDFGTTFSGVSFTVLDPGQVPKIHSVTRFPGQENGDFKIPSVVCYAQDGRILAVGAEARHSNLDPDEEPVFVKWFKLYLCPQSMEPAGLSLPPLPPGKTVVRIIADFFAYLFNCARKYICESVPNGESVWTSVGDRIEVILGQPNGWSGAQQAKMRQAAILAQIIPDTPAGRARLHFITEGEASLHYCVNSGLVSGSIKDESSVMIVDAGGGTVDLTTYKFVTADPIAVEETAAPGCILQGSTRVNARFEEYLQKRLAGSRYGHADDIKEMLRVFERSTKPTFKTPSVRSYIKFGRVNDKDARVGVQNGKLVIQGEDLVNLFQPCIDEVVAAVRDQRRLSSAPINIVFLVGGFAASPWLYNNLCEILKDDGMEVYRPDSHTNKAVSEGAATYFLHKYVTTRVARMTWGFACNIPYCADNPEHYKRRHNVVIDAGGQERLGGVFKLYISEGARLTENDVICHQWIHKSRTPEGVKKVSTDVICYRGTQASPYWMDEDPDSYWPLYTVRADTSGIYKHELLGTKGIYYLIGFDIVLTVGLTTLQAQIRWKERENEKAKRWSLFSSGYDTQKADRICRGEAEIVYEESVNYLLE